MKRTVLAVALIGAVILLTGCVVGRGPMGEIVMGLDVGKMPETLSEIGGTVVSGFLGPQVGGIVSAVLATVLGGGGIAVAGSKMASREKSRRTADQGREKAEKEVVALRAILNATGLLKSQPAAEEEPVDPST